MLGTTIKTKSSSDAITMSSISHASVGSSSSSSCAMTGFDLLADKIRAIHQAITTDTTINKCDSNSDGDDNWDGNGDDDGNEDERSDDDNDDDDGSDSSNYDKYGNNNNNNDNNDDNDNDKQTQKSTNATSTVTATATTMATKTKTVMAQTVDSGTIDKVKEQLSLLSQFKDSYVKVQNRIHGQGEDDFDQTAHDLHSKLPFLKKRRVGGNGSTSEISNLVDSPMTNGNM
jgi:hypothetical protein